MNRADKSKHDKIVHMLQDSQVFRWTHLQLQAGLQWLLPIGVEVQFKNNTGWDSLKKKCSSLVRH